MDPLIWGELSGEADITGLPAGSDRFFTVDDPAYEVLQSEGLAHDFAAEDFSFTDLGIGEIERQEQLSTDADPAPHLLLPAQKLEAAQGGQLDAGYQDIGAGVILRTGALCLREEGAVLGSGKGLNLMPTPAQHTGEQLADFRILFDDDGSRSHASPHQSKVAAWP